jgi:hypothetical protein
MQQHAFIVATYALDTSTTMAAADVRVVERWVVQHSTANAQYAAATALQPLH